MKSSILESLSNLMVEKECWLIVAGAGTGSIVNLGFGSKTKLDRPLSNPHLLEEERLFEPEYSIMIYCAWRLSSSGEIICGWRDSNEKDGPMLSRLELLRGKKLRELVIGPIGFDLNLHFEDEMCFQIFCDITNDYDADDNYVIFSNDNILSIGLKSSIFIEQRGKA